MIPKLYQYYQVSDKSICNFFNSEVYLSEPSGFNDPFDSLLILSKEEILDGLLDLPVMNVWKSSVYGMRNKEVILNACNKNVALMDLASAGDQHAQSVVDLLDSFYDQMHFNGSRYRDYLGVSCFSEKCDNPLMWAHYADKGTGFCVCYDFKRNVELAKHLLPVIYSNRPYYSREFVNVAYQMVQYEKKDIDKIDDIPLIKSSVVKPSEWEYEDEWRLIVSQKDMSTLFSGKRLVLHPDRNQSISPVFLPPGGAVKP